MAAAARRGSANSASSASTDVARSVDAFRRVLRALRVAARKTELATGLSAAQLFVLSAVAEAPGCSVNDIAAATMTDRSSAAAIVDRLVDQGYLMREQAGDDRRRAAISLTARGKRIKIGAAPAPTALLLAGIKKLSSAELRALTQGLTALTEGMGIANEPAGMLFEDSTPSVRGKRARRS